MEGGSYEGSAPEAGSAPTADLLLGFLSDFRSAAQPSTPNEGDDDEPEPEYVVAEATADAAFQGAVAPPLQPAYASSAGDRESWAPTHAQEAGSPTWPPSIPLPGYWPAPSPPPAPSNGKSWRPSGRGGLSRRGAVAIAVLAAVTMGAVAGVAVAQRRGSQPSYPAAWDPRVAPLAAFVQSQRGLKWKHPVKVEFLAPAKFEARMAKESSPGAKSMSQAQIALDVMRAIGVASGNIDLGKAAQQFAQSDVVGQYVDSDRTVYVSGDQLTPYVQSVLAHELTHALQAQYFDLEKMRSGHADDDSAVTALIEGDAVRVQNAYEQSLSQADQDLLIQEQQQTSGQATTQNTQSGIPQFMIDQAEFPYDFGPTFVAALVAKDGNHQVDAAFKNPPVLDGQIVDPETFIPGAGVPKVTTPPLPKGAHQALPATGFGEVPLLEMLGDQIGFDQAWSAVQGWTQDQMVAYSQNGTVCANIAVLNDSPDSAASLLQAARAWASHLSSASARQSGATVDFHACDPGPAWKPTTHVADPYQALAVRSVLMYQLITDAHVDTTKSVCAVDQLMTTMGPQKLQDAEQSTDPSSPAVQDLSAEVASALSSCS